MMDIECQACGNLPASSGNGEYLQMCHRDVKSCYSLQFWYEALKCVSGLCLSGEAPLRISDLGKRQESFWRC